MSIDSPPRSGRCPIGSLGLHTLNHERPECIWCGPGYLAGKPGNWVTSEDGTYQAWSADKPEELS